MAGPRIHRLHTQQILLHPDYRALVSSHVYITISATHGQPHYPVQCIRRRSHHAHRLTDSDFTGDPDDRKLTSHYVFMLAGGAITWRARKQPLVAFSMVEAEYIRASNATKEAIWVRTLYARILYGKVTEPQQIFVDNQGAIQLAKNPKLHECTKHISVRFHFVCDACKRNAIKTSYLPTSDMLADIMTKNLPCDTHWKHAHGLGLVSRTQGKWLTDHALSV